MRKTIITGRTGFIGSWLIQELLKENIDVTVITRKKERLPENVRNQCQIIEKPMEYLEIDDFEKDYGFDVFFHLGWDGVSPGQKNDIRLQIKNINMSLRMLELSNCLKCGKFLAAGTVAEYSLHAGTINAGTLQKPNDMYGAAKTSARHFLEVRARQLDQSLIWMILPSIYGEKRTDNNIITYTICTLLEGNIPRYGDLSQMWDFLYISDAVRAIRMIGECGIPGKVYGIGSGQYWPVRRYMEEIRDMIDPKLKLGIGLIPQMSGRSVSSCVDIYELVKDTSFEPQISFRQGILRTIQWTKENRTLLMRGGEQQKKKKTDSLSDLLFKEVRIA